MNASFFKQLGLLDCAVFEHVEGDVFKVLHSDEKWFASVFFPYAQSELYIFNDSPFYLVDFLFEANEFWSKNTDGKINSGIWNEQIAGDVLRLEASAVTINSSHYLIIFNMENEFNKRQKTLQSARELLISNDTILEQHELILERLEELLSGSELMSDDSFPMRQVINDAGFGVAIVDENMQPIELNRMLYNLFEMKEADGGAPFELLLKLCNSQFPEFNRTLITGSRLNSELYWLKPPALSRWLQLTICPIKREKKDTSKRYWLFLVTDVTREKYLKQSNEKLAYFDSLTNLPNRQYFWQYLESFIESNQELYVMLLDVKRLKRVNERFGFSVGDQMLKEVVARIAPLLKTNDVFARIGGNEFAVILHGSDMNRSHAVAEGMISVVEEPYYVLNKHKCNVGLSIGVANFPSDGLNAEDLMKYADLASFAAKQDLKSKVYFYSEELKDSFTKRIDLENALREAIDQNQFELYFQPILSLASDEITQGEVLIRWLRPSFGMVSPAEFIPIAEQTGQIVAIGKWVILETIKLLAQFHGDNKKIKLSVNLSPMQINDGGLLEFIIKQVKLSNIDASYLELELTEGVLVDDFEKVKYFLDEVRKLGISIAIDDFGTGYSSLSYLQKLPIDYLKIDQSFIFELMESMSSQGIVKAIISMAESLDLEVIAEGVETEVQKDFLKNHYCQFAQGYLFSRPLPYDDFFKLLEK